MRFLKTIKVDLSCFHILVYLEVQTLVICCSEILALFKTIDAKTPSGNARLKFSILHYEHLNNIM